MLLSASPNLSRYLGSASWVSPTGQPHKGPPSSHRGIAFQHEQQYQEFFGLEVRLCLSASRSRSHGIYLVVPVRAAPPAGGTRLRKGLPELAAATPPDSSGSLFLRAECRSPSISDPSLRQHFAGRVPIMCKLQLYGKCQKGCGARSRSAVGDVLCNHHRICLQSLPQLLMGFLSEFISASSLPHVAEPLDDGCGANPAWQTNLHAVLLLGSLILVAVRGVRWHIICRRRGSLQLLLKRTRFNHVRTQLNTSPLTPFPDCFYLE